MMDPSCVPMWGSTCGACREWFSHEFFIPPLREHKRIRLFVSPADSNWLRLI